MATGVYQLATVQSDVMTYAYNGTRSFEKTGAVPNVRILAGIYAETVQIVTTNPDIKTVADLKGKAVCVGDQNSGTYFNEAMVHMAQPFAMSLPLVDGHGNFGSIDGDTAAAMRYTEARMTDAAMQLLRDIDLDTVDYSLNFDDTLKEPDLLPGRFPNLLINGAAGIAVGLATNIPPHNPGEAIDAAVAMIDDPKISLKKLMEIMPAPDFPTGGYLIDSPEIAAASVTISVCG